MISFGQVLILVGIFAAAILCGVTLGAYFTFRAKREPHEPFVGSTPKGEVFSLDTFESADTEEATLPETVKSRSADFLNQFTEGLK